MKSIPAPLPTGTVGTGTFQQLLGLCLGHEVARPDILNLTIQRDSARATKQTRKDNKRTLKVRIGPSGGRDAGLGTGRWTFGDVVRMSALLRVVGGTPRMRAAIWVGLADEFLLGVFQELESWVETALSEPRFQHINDAPIERRAGELWLAIYALGRRGDQFVLDVPLDGRPAVLMPSRQSKAFGYPTGFYVNADRAMLAAMVAWKTLSSREVGK